MVTTARGQSFRFLWLEITRRCNLTCLHCYADSGPELDLEGAMTPSAWSRVIAEAAELGCPAVQFIGGEPTLHPHLLAMIRQAKEAGIGSVEVFTNGTGVTDGLAEAFRDLGVSAACSFYSADRATHDKITRRAGSFAQTVRGIRRLLDRGVPVRAELIEMEENRGQLQEARAFLQRLGVTRGGADRQRGIGRGQRLGLLKSPMEELCGRCWQGRLCVTAVGEVYPCVFSRFCPLGDARQGLAEILRSERLAKFQTELREAQAKAHGSALGCKPDCGPDPCNPTDQCNPDCTPHYGCSPQEPGCNPDANCRPAQS